MTAIKLEPFHQRNTVSPLLYGIFFEDINYAGDGGLYAELIANRSFEYYDRNREISKHSLCWEAAGDCSFRILDRIPLSREHTHYASLSGPAGSGIRNSGFCGEGFAVREGQAFRFSCFARNAAPMSLIVRFVDKDGVCFGEKKLPLVRAGHGFTKYTCTITATGTSRRVYPCFLLGKDGGTDLELLSLFPADTFKERPNGMRRDIAEMIADLSPKFMRFPGGCIVEGRSFDNMYNWKETIGELCHRRTNWNRWQMEEYQLEGRSSEDYFQSYGLGFFEYFQFCEDIGATPIPVMNVGMTCQWHEALLVEMDKLEPWIQDVLDLISFANDGPDTEWGKKRADMGHPQPFHLEYIGIGNEQWGEEYFERYEAFEKVLSKRHPEIRLITCAGWTSEGEDFELAYRWMRRNRDKAYAVDEHFYKSPRWFLDNVNRYDSYDRTLPKVFAGEYAAHTSPDTPLRENNWEAALSEAAFLTGVEKNADHVVMACYAPLLGRSGHQQWQPDLIWFDNDSVYGTPSYYVQKLFSNHTGTSQTEVQGSLPDTLKLSSTLSGDKKHLYVKLVNLSGTAETVSLQLPLECPWSLCLRHRLARELTAVNSHESPRNVYPDTAELSPAADNALTETLPRYSVTVLDFHL